MKVRAGRLLFGLGVRLMGVAIWIMDHAEGWAPILPPAGMVERILERLRREEAVRDSWLATPRNWRDRV